MNQIRIANAPCSWGTLEFEGMKGERVPYGRMLDEMSAAGYVGTELGDWGYLPTDPAALRAELARRGLNMVGALVPVALRHEGAHEAGEAEALRVARMLAAVAGDTAGQQRPCIVLADDNGSDPARTLHAGRVTPGIGLSNDEWKVFARGAESIARAIWAESALPVVFHHHCAGYVETPAEIARFLEMTDPDLVGLAFDTGHYLYGCGAARGGSALEGLELFGDRIRHVHFKDCHPAIAGRARSEGWDYFEAVRRGLFCELGRGNVDFPGVTAWLRSRAWSGWIVVEQDVLPGMGAPAESAMRNREYLRSIGL
ncbi:MAG: TIM barrel protein [Acidobacteriota bacterium]